MKFEKNLKFDKIIYGAKVALPNAEFGHIWPDPIDGILLGIKDNKIELIAKKDNIIEISFDKEIVLDGGIITAGFIDTQVNGGGGVLFNDAPTKETSIKILNAHRRFGTTSILPTLISDDLEKVEQANAAVRQAIEDGESGIIGIHLEGPFLNSEKKGIHDNSKFKVLDERAIEIMAGLKIAPILITIAPELQPPEMLAKLDNMPWVIISAGHTNATAYDMMIGGENGIRGVTHLFNAMRQMSAREPGVVGFALEKRILYCGIIADLVHVDAQNIRLAYDLLGVNKLMLVTDAMNPVGSDIKEFTLFGQKITARDGSCFDENGTLAGSALDMASAVKNMHNTVRVPIGACLQMASETPARFLYLHEKIGSIREGLRADLIHLDEDLNFIQVL